MRALIGGTLVVLAVAFSAQLALVDYAPPPDNGQLIVGGEAGAILDAACMDCHSNETVWPWYSRVPPGSFLVHAHVQEGREELNLSRWDDYDARAALRKLDHVIEEVEEGRMPHPQYVRLHPEADLDDDQRQVLVDWAAELRAGYARELGLEEMP